MDKITHLQNQITGIYLEIQRCQDELCHIQEQLDEMTSLVNDHPLPEELLSINIRDLRMTCRTTNVLLANGIRQIRDIRYYSYKDIRHFNGFGTVCLSELKRVLTRLGVIIQE